MCSAVSFSSRRSAASRRASRSPSRAPVAGAPARGGSRDRPDGDPARDAVHLDGGLGRRAEYHRVPSHHVEEVRTRVGLTQAGVGGERVGAGSGERSRGHNLEDIPGDDVALQTADQRPVLRVGQIDVRLGKGENRGGGKGGSCRSPFPRSSLFPMAATTAAISLRSRAPRHGNSPPRPRRRRRWPPAASGAAGDRR